MAVRGNEVEGIGGGIEADAPTKGTFALNMLYRNNSWEARSGFGQVAEIDTSMGAIRRGASTDEWGYRRHLGSRVIETNFGHQQILSVFDALVYTGDREEGDPYGATADENALSLTAQTPIYVVSIYDITTDEHWESPLYYHTSSNSTSTDTKVEMDEWHANFESAWQFAYEYPVSDSAVFPDMPNTRTVNNQSWIRATDNASPFFFTETNDELFFGNTDTGLMAYIPATFRGFRKGRKTIQRRGREHQVDTVHEWTWSPHYGESSMVVPVTAADGPYSAGMTYLNKTEFPRPSGGTAFNGRLVLFSGRSLYFSDFNYPASILANNLLPVGSEKEITAVVEHVGNLIIFTEDETWYYQPTQGVVVTTGRLVRLDPNRGCADAGSIVTAGGGLVWMDKNGVYVMRGLSIQTISSQISPFFTDYMSNPLTNFFTKSGNISNPVPQEQQLTRLRFNPEGMSATYCHKLKAIIWALPANDLMLYYREDKWAIWTTQTMANTALDVQVQKNIRSPWVGSTPEELFLIGSYPDGVAGQTADSQIIDMAGNRRANDDTRSRPYYLLRYERGGSVDRSVELGEDNRGVVGRWRRDGVNGSGSLTPPQTDHFLYVGKPIPVPTGLQLRTLGATTSREDTYLVPIDVVCGTTFYDHLPAPPTLSRATHGIDTGYDIGYQRIEILLYFDKTHWTPLTVPGLATGVDFALDSERLPTFKTGGGTSTWTVTRADAAGVADAAGSYINISFNSANGGAGTTDWAHWPFLNTPAMSLSRLLYIPFEPTQSAALSAYTVGMGIEVKNSNVFPEKPSRSVTNTQDYLNLIPYVWDESKLGTIESEDNNVAQPIDWAYKTQNISAEGDVQIKGRGVNVVGISHGMADTTLRLVDTWPFGLLNCVSGSDTKEWSAQVIDVVPATDAANSTENTPAVVSSPNKTSIRTRYKKSGTASLVPDTFTNSGTDGPFYGNTGQAATNYAQLVDDEEVSLLNISDGIRGQSVSYMLWGHLQNKAEKIVLESAKIVIRVLGGVRRKGR